MPKNTELAAVRAILNEHMMDTFAFEDFGGMTREEISSWFHDIVVPDVEKILSL
ncbi:hypothetical protein [Alicyclobacillus fastidiosus]|uniref:hypothetical protein n=1 Tax=Alicyclobacillus fastidiosus TaxID=392011 RepID=UPI0023E9F66A|nr:hypothetical protein [Alicyclobacillus fastidiosus]GMA66022.1 hypothetical protein GCM10025859_64640 [Alicyclobacillus fastidiosus]